MGKKSVRGIRRRVAIGLSAVLVGTLVQATAAEAKDPSTARPETANADSPVAGSTAEVTPRTVDKAPKTPAADPKAAWPKGGTATAAVPAAGTRSRSRAGSLPVTLSAAPGKASKAAKVAKAKVRLLDRAAAEKAGVDGVLLSVSRADQGTTSGSLGLRLDYSAFAESYGGNWAGRLKLVRLPACALTTPALAKCRTAVPVEAVNDTEAQTLTAPTVTLARAATTSTVLAATATASGGTGDFTATSLSASATWKSDLNTGDFSWSYPLTVPDVPGSLVPSLGLGYSSGSIDGRTTTTNNQGSWVGDGFSLWSGFIERGYKTCADDGIKKDGVDNGDLCWGYDNATISFNGRGGELVPAGNDIWKLRNDDGTRIEKLTGSSTDVRDNGDNNQEYWKVTTTDGTQYYFGYHKLPGWASGKETTDSTWTVPVYGDDDGEPCHAGTYAASWCQQAYRWNLDYVVDQRGNALAYYYDKETNSYGRNLEPADDTPYTRGGTLDRIEYGLRSTTVYSAKALGRVDFTSAERCLPETGVTCAADTIDDKSSYWYDTPWDQDCKAGTDCDTQFSPSFWTRNRLTSVATQVLNSGGTYTDVDSWAFGHRWGMADIDYSLLLDSIQHTGKSATPNITLPKVTFAYHQDANRLDKTGDGDAPFIKERLSTVVDEAGGQIDINYSAATCDWDNLPTPQTNTTRCFPVFTSSSGEPDPVKQWFNKYVVASVTETDRTGGAPDKVTRYEYLGGAAWHFDDDGLTKEKYKTWSQWRGYGHVRAETGGQAGMITQSDHYYLRGMDGDRKGTADSDGTKTVTVDNGEGTTLTDHEAHAGFEYRTETYSGVGGGVLAKTVSQPWHHETAKRTRSWGTTTANFTGTTSTKSFTSLDAGAGAKWRTTSTATEFESTYGRPTQQDDFGDTTTSADDQCTRTTYADNTTLGILGKPARVETVAVKCSATPDRSKDVIADVRTAYDGGAYGAAPTRGLATTTGALSRHDGSNATYTESATTYDSYGRGLTATDVSGTSVFNSAGTPTRTDSTDKRVTTTGYSPTTGIPATVTTTSPPAVTGTASTAQTSTTTLDPLRGRPVTVLDTNSKRTDRTYDALGRNLKLWLPNRSQANSDTPNYEFSYTVATGSILAVGTKTLKNDGTQQTGYTLYDGFLRPRQTQDVGPDGGRLIADNFYDERGLTAKSFATYYATGAPATTLFKVDNVLSVETQTWNTYDGLGRNTVTKQIAGNGDGGAELAVTTATYGGDRVTVDPPTGAAPTTTVTDARGRTSELWTFRGATPTGDHDTTAYTYTPAGNLQSVTDPVGNVWSYTYDQRGLEIESKDPDKGKLVTAYDVRGQVVSTTDARTANNTLYRSYDNIGRQTALRDGSATGTLLAEWAYDPSGAEGQLASSTRYVGTNAYKTTVNIYDSLYRPNRTTVTIPAAEGALQGSYQFNTKYNSDGTVQSGSYPAAGALASEVVAPTYDAVQRPVELAGASTYVTDTKYSLTGKPQQYEYTTGGKKTWSTSTYEWGTQRLATSRVDREDVAGVDRYDTYAYDQADNILSVTDTSRDGTDAQCFSYDYLRRLTEAWAQSSKTCAATPSASVLGGPAPYWHSYTYDKAANGASMGNRAGETKHDVTGVVANDVTSTYTSPPAGSAKPHSLTQVSSKTPTGTQLDSYTYGATGNTDTRSLHGTDQALTWDTEGNLVKVVEKTGSGAAKTTSYIYDADGNRLIRDVDGTKTLSLGGTEITLAKGATTPTATRYYDLGDGQAIRTNDNKVSFLIGDHNGTAELAVNATDLTMQQRRSTPFGGSRGTQPTAWPGEKGFVGGTQDSTGLTHLGAREYDPTTGRFISVDPVMEPTDAQQMQGYAYSSNSPVTGSDPSGLFCDGCSANEDNSAWDPTTHGPGCTAGGCYDDDGKLLYTVSGDGGSNSDNDTTTTTKPKAATTQVTLGGVTVPEEKALRAMGYQGYDQTYDQGVRRYARGVCMHDDIPTARFCSAAGALGWLEYPETGFDRFLKEAIGVADAERCAHGSTSGCVWTVVGLIPFTKVAKVAKVLKAGKGAKGAEAVADACKLNSFLAGTEVLLADGTRKEIEDVEVGDKVIATDPGTGTTGPRDVVATIITRTDKEFATVTVRTPEGEEAIVATAHHSFWVASERDWRDAGDLQPGMSLRTDDGRTVQVSGVDHFGGRRTTYNLTVQGDHTYYVLAGTTPVLVHNDKPLPTQVTGRNQPLTNKQAQDLASYLGFKKTNYRVRGQTVFTDGKTFITQDIGNGDGSHNGGTWKTGKSVDALGQKSTRTATTDALLNRIGC